MRRIAVGLMVMGGLLLAMGPAAMGEVFVLTSGGRVVGELLNPDESPRQTFVVKTSDHGRVVLARSQVKQVLHPRAEQLEYEKLRPRFPDTVPGQWALAEWCRQKRLLTERNTHLERIVELDPDHAQARRALGYSQVDGRWVTQDQLMQQRGYKKYKGKWMLPQEIELIENKQTAEDAEDAWSQKLPRWRKWLFTKRDSDGRQNIMEIKDPHAVTPLVRLLTSDASQHARVMYVEVLANIGTPEAVKALATCSMEDPDEEVRLTCLDFLQKAKHPDVVTFYVGKLEDKNNAVVNLAAVGLGRMKDPSAVGPLIDALVTTHKYRIVSGTPGSMSSTFGTGPGGSGAPGGSGLSMGGKPKIYARQHFNQAVLDALVTITGHNFSYDQQAWKYWYTSQKKRDTLDARRD